MESLRPRGMIEYIVILWRKKLLIFLVAASVSVATYLLVRRIPSLYESRALIVISNPVNGNDGGSVSTPSLTALTQRMISEGNLMGIVRRHNLYQQTPWRFDGPSIAVERLRKEVKVDIKMRNYYPEAPESLTISYCYTDPATAQRVVADLVSVFEQANVSARQQASTELERFRLKIEEVESQLKGLTPQGGAALLGGETARNIDNGSSTIRAQRQAAVSSIDSLSDKEFMLERQLDEQKRQIAEQENLVKSAGPASGLQSNSAYGILLARRAEVEGQIRDLSTFATEKNPKMAQARAQLAAINREITRLEAASGTNLGSAVSLASPEARELRAMQREKQRLETELEVTRREMGRKTQGLNALPNVGVAGASTSAGPSSGLNSDSKAEHDRLMGRHTWLIGKLDSLQMQSGDDGQKISMFQLIDAPRAQSAPVGPNRRSLMLLGMGIALALGLLAAAAREVPRLFMINNDRDVEYYLGTPVLAMIPETMTSFERSRRRRLSGLRWLGLGLLAAVMIPVFIAGLDRSRVVPMLCNSVPTV